MTRCAHCGGTRRETEYWACLAEPGREVVCCRVRLAERHPACRWDTPHRGHDMPSVLEYPGDPNALFVDAVNTVRCGGQD